jgi:aminoglycoside phosphotransferase family enzyme/predicted kinase
MSSTAREPPFPTLIEGLLRPDAYGHPVGSVRLSETHISWVLLAGEFAYKIKKPVDFGFLDFSTLERRRFFCEEELRLNRRHAPDLYLAVRPITGTPDKPRLGGSGTALEYAVQMRRFDDALLLERLALEHRLRPEHLDRLADTLADFHATIARATPDDTHGLPEHQREAAELNFSRLQPLPAEAGDIAILDALHRWTRAEYARHEPLMHRRKAGGGVRECHGDLHLGNIVLLDGCPTLFDGIEFNEDLRWIDVLSELAFLVMDLEVHGAPALAWRLLNRYLESTGDYAGMPLFDYFRVYRAMVRAKIAQLTRAQTEDPGRQAELQARYRSYVGYALGLIQSKTPRIFITHGLSGSGKSQLAGRLAERLPAVRLRSDVERKRLAELAPDARTGAPEADGLYGAEMTARTYARLAELAGLLLEAGHSVIVDATFLQRAQRDEQRRVAERCGAEFRILDCRAPVEVLRERIRARAAAGSDPSEADLAVLEWQMARREALGEDERAWALEIETGGELDIEALLAAATSFGFRSPSEPGSDEMSHLEQHTDNQSALQ